MLKRRKESDNYLVADRRHRRSTQIAMKVDKCVAFSRHSILLQEFDSERKKIMCRCLRYIAHTLGATLQFYSSKEPGLVKKAKDLLNHHGFGGPPV